MLHNLCSIPLGKPHIICDIFYTFGVQHYVQSLHTLECNTCHVKLKVKCARTFECCDLGCAYPRPICTLICLGRCVA